ncbi:MAG: hypothetical protein ACI832_001615 [Rheinheimera aquimaris]|jgi:hypothetical protein
MASVMESGHINAPEILNETRVSIQAVSAYKAGCMPVALSAGFHANIALNILLNNAIFLTG